MTEPTIPAEKMSGTKWKTEAEMLEDIARIVDIIDGNEDKDIPGLRARVRDLEAWREEYKKEWTRFKLLLLGIAIGLGASTGGIYATLIKILGLLAGAP